jgi:hypothetical protein
MLMLFNMQWIGTYNQFTQYLENVKKLSNTITGVTFKGVYVPSDEWSYTLLFDLDRYANMVQLYHTFVKKYLQPDSRSNIALGRWTLLHTPEELGYPI